MNRRLLPKCKNPLHIIDGPECRYHLGVIDFFTKWECRQRSSRILRSVRYCCGDHSTIPPRLWSTETGQCVIANTISRNLITQVKWAPSADMIAQSGEDKEVRIFDSRNLQVIRTFPKKQYIQTWCDISQDNNYCLTCSNGFGGQGCEATLWDIRTSQAVHEYKGHHETACCCVFLPGSFRSGGSPMIATSSNDCTVRIWNQDTRECLDCLSLAGSGPLTSIAAQEDGLVVSSFNAGLHMIKMVPGSSSEWALQVAATF